MIARKGNSINYGTEHTKLSMIIALDTPSGEARGFTKAGLLAAKLKLADGHQILVTITPAGKMKGFIETGIGSNRKFVWFGVPSISEAGLPAIRGVVAGRGFGATNNQGIYVDTPSAGWTVAVQTGKSAIGAGASFATLGEPVVNNNSQVAFIATLTDGRRGVWANTSGAMSLVALTQAAAPDTNGALFSDFVRLALPAQGGAIVVADLAPGTGDATPSNDQGIWAVNRAGELHKVVRTGDIVTVNGIDRTISTLSMFDPTPEVAAQPACYNSAGNLIYKATFNDGTSALFEVTFP